MRSFLKIGPIIIKKIFFQNRDGPLKGTAETLLDGIQETVVRWWILDSEYHVVNTVAIQNSFDFDQMKQYPHLCL